jgi:hypothetical protein
MNANARFTHMKDGTQEDWAIIAADFSAYARQLPDPDRGAPDAAGG